MRSDERIGQIPALNREQGFVRFAGLLAARRPQRTVSGTWTGLVAGVIFLLLDAIAGGSSSACRLQVDAPLLICCMG